MEQAEEIQLIARSRSGDTTAFGQLVDQHKGYVLRVCLRLLGNLDDAQDVAQETFLQAFLGLERFRADARFATWLYRTAVHDVPWMADDVLPAEHLLAHLPDVARQKARAINRVVLEEAVAGVLGVGGVVWIALSLHPVSALSRVLAALWGLLSRLVLGRPLPWSVIPLLGAGLVGSAVVGGLLHGLRGSAFAIWRRKR